MWRLNLDPKNPNPQSPDKQHVSPKMIKVIFNLLSLCKTFLWYHASAAFPPKETFINAIRNGNYATWSKLMVTLINCYYPNSDKIKGHLKGQCKGIQLTKQKELGKIIENETVRIKIEGKKSPLHHIPLTKTHEAFFRIEDPSNSIHTDHMGAFPFTSQQGNRYIIVMEV
jgi:hypothetical protein